jgi:hypothetical protein
MVALIVSYVVLAYFLAPRAIFRGLASIALPLKLQRSRTEEITFAFWISLLPLVLASFITLAPWRRSLPRTWFDYEEVFSGSYSEKIFDANPGQFWISVGHLIPRQLEFLGLYYVLVLIEAVCFVLMIEKYGNWNAKCRPYGWFVERILLQSLSEWYALLELFTFEDNPKRKVAVDVLIAEDHLYQGDVTDYFLDNDGTLSGLILGNSRRFDRIGYLRDKERDSSIKSEDYWRDIPSAGDSAPILYIAREKILNLNLRYPLSVPSETAIAAATELRKEGMKVEISPVSPVADVRPRDISVAVPEFAEEQPVPKPPQK